MEFSSKPIFFFQIGPTKTAYDVCKELSGHMKLSVHELILEEIVLNDKLIRPIHYQEKVSYSIDWWKIDQIYNLLLGIRCCVEVELLGWTR